MIGQDPHRDRRVGAGPVTGHVTADPRVIHCPVSPLIASSLTTRRTRGDKRERERWQTRSDEPPPAADICDTLGLLPVGDSRQRRKNHLRGPSSSTRSSLDAAGRPRFGYVGAGEPAFAYGVERVVSVGWTSCWRGRGQYYCRLSHRLSIMVPTGGFGPRGEV